jgi:hypothetical protein
MSFLDSFSLRLRKKRHDSAHFLANCLPAGGFYHVPIHPRIKAFTPVVVKGVARNSDNRHMSRRA